MSAGAGGTPATWTLAASSLPPLAAGQMRAGLCGGLNTAPRRQQAVLAGPDVIWPRQAQRLIDRLIFSVAAMIIRVDHIGSTSVPGLPAKQLIDIQVVVADLSAAAHVAEAARRSGFVRVPGQWFGTDQQGVDHPEEVVVDADPGRPVNISIRPVTAPIWRETLPFRDQLRSHGDERSAYAELKRGLAQRPGCNVDDYSTDKIPGSVMPCHEPGNSGPLELVALTVTPNDVSGGGDSAGR